MRYLFLCLLLLAGCKREPAPEFVDFIFQVPLTLAPARDTVAVGDTLWLTADFSDQLQEFYSGQKYQVTPGNFELRALLGLFKLTNPSKDIGSQPAATESFTFVNQIGSVTRRGATFSGVQYVYKQGSYQLHVGLIPRARGVFCINFLDGWLSRDRDDPGPDLSYIELGQTAEGGKRRASFRIIFYRINDGQTNFNLFRQHCQAASLVYPEPDNINYEQKATFTFVVK